MPPEETARAPLADVPLGVGVRLGARDADRVEPELSSPSLHLGGRHRLIVLRTIGSLKAIRIHEDGGPEVLRYEDAPDPAPGPDEVVVELRAASLNRLDLWIRAGRPSVPKPRILGADGAGVLAGTDERVVINPGLAHDGRVEVLGEHRDGTHAELVAVPRSAVHPIPDGLSFEEAAAFPLVFLTAYRMLVTRARLEPGEWVLVWGVGGGVGTAALAIAKALGANVVVTSSSDEKLERALGLGADAALNHDRDDVPALGRDQRRRRARRRRARRRGDLGAHARRCPLRRARGRLRRLDGPEPAGRAPSRLVARALDPRLDDGDARRLRRRLRARRRGKGAAGRRQRAPARRGARGARAHGAGRPARQDRAPHSGVTARGVIRPCRDDERAVVLEIVNGAAEAYRGVIPADRWHEPYMDARELDGEIEAGVAFWGYELAGALVGVMGVQRVRDVDLVRHAYVRPESQGQGVGGALLGHLRGASPRRMLVGTWAAAEWAVRFYRRHGFEPVGRERTDALLRTYWAVPDAQIESSVVLANPPLVPPWRCFAMAERKRAEKAPGFTEEEREAMKERARELKAEARASKNREDGERDVLAAIAKMQAPDRALAERLHAIVAASAPALSPKTWYGMPAYALDGKVVCFFQSGQKFKTRYATLGFSDAANLDEGAMWPTAFALEKLTAAEEARIVALVKKAVS